MIWFQAACEPGTPKPWVVLRCYLTYGGVVQAGEISRWPTKHEAEGHARKQWERL